MQFLDGTPFYSPIELLINPHPNFNEVNILGNQASCRSLVQVQKNENFMIQEDEDEDEYTLGHMAGWEKCKEMVLYLISDYNKYNNSEINRIVDAIKNAEFKYGKWPKP